MLAAQPARQEIAAQPRLRVATHTLSATAIELLAVGGAAIAATLARIPSLMVIPAFTDEVEEIALGLAIVRDGVRPLTNVDPYIGPLWNYLLAALFWMLGPSIEIPRAAVLTAGVLTVLLTYLVGRVWYGRRVGLLGATLLAASAAHTAVNSHVAWSNCVTPLFTTAGLLALSLAFRDNRPRLLPVAGLLFGLAFHTHPTAAPLLAGAAAAVVLVHPGWLMRPWPYVAGAVALLANVNLLVYNVLTGGRTFSYAQEIQESYLQEAGQPAGYIERLGDLLLGLARTLGSSLERRPTVLEYVTDPLVMVAVTLAGIGLVLAIQRRVWLPLLVVGISVLALPLVNPKYDPILNVRYLAPILPICLLWIGLALQQLAESPGTASFAQPGLAGRLPGVIGAGRVMAASLLATVLVVGAATALDGYYEGVRENARTGARILDLVRIAQQRGPAGLPVILDERLERMSLGPGAGIVLRVLHLTLELEGIPTEVRWLGEQRPPEAREGQLVVLAARSKPQFTGEAVAALGLRTVGGEPARVHSQASRYGLYEFGPPAGERSKRRTPGVRTRVLRPGATDASARLYRLALSP